MNEKPTFEKSLDFTKSFQELVKQLNEKNQVICQKMIEENKTSIIKYINENYVFEKNKDPNNTFEELLNKYEESILEQYEKDQNEGIFIFIDNLKFKLSMKLDHYKADYKLAGNNVIQSLLNGSYPFNLDGIQEITLDYKNKKILSEIVSCIDNIILNLDAKKDKETIDTLIKIKYKLDSVK